VLLLCQLLLALGLLVLLLKPFQGCCQALMTLCSAADVADEKQQHCGEQAFCETSLNQAPQPAQLLCKTLCKTQSCRARAAASTNSQPATTGYPPAVSAAMLHNLYTADAAVAGTW
jgi:hypothetical protein